MKKNTFRPVHGVLILDKPEGISSNQALQKVKRLFQAEKAGHTGSLDVLATGLLPICFGEATKLSSLLLEADKSYEVVAQLGKRTSTGDREGEIIEFHPTHTVTLESIHSILKKFVGEVIQIPPMYSAIKHQGIPLYRLARKGIAVERKERKITIYSIEFVKWELDFLTLKISCSKGTYIRTLIEDIGVALGCGAYTFSLRRVSSGKYQENQMMTFEKLEYFLRQGGFAELDKQLYSLESLAQDLPAVSVSDEVFSRLQHGQRVTYHHSFPIGQWVRLYNPSHHWLGIGIMHSPSQLACYRLWSYD